jgi:hypothetical protein
MSEWISVKDEMPEYDTPVLVYRWPDGNDEQHPIFVAVLDNDVNIGVHFASFVNGHIGVNITHWMPLPEPPQEIENVRD